MPERRIVDLSHPIRAGHAPGTEFAMDVITMIGNTGTYLDSPFHRYADGKDLAGLDLSTMVAAPPAVEGFGTFPVRAFAELTD